MNGRMETARAGEPLDARTWSKGFKQTISSRRISEDQLER